MMNILFAAWKLFSFRWHFIVAIVFSTIPSALSLSPINWTENNINYGWSRMRKNSISNTLNDVQSFAIKNSKNTHTHTFRMCTMNIGAHNSEHK